MKPLKTIVNSVYKASQFIFQQLILILVFLLLSGVICEFIVKKYSSPKQLFSEGSMRLLNDLPLEERKQFLEDKTNIASLEQFYHDYHLWSLSPFRSKSINITNYYNSRKSPDSCVDSLPSEIIWTFGGSTMQNLETTDSRTIANNIAKVFKTKGDCVAIHNFGVGSFHSSLELIKFQDILKRVPEPERPSVVIFYDGYNDAHHSFSFGAGNMQKDLSNKLRMMVEKDYLSLSRYAISSWLASHSLFFKKYFFPHLIPSKKIYSGMVFDGSQQNLNKAVSIYLQNMQLIKAITNEYKMMPIFILQPLITSKKGLTTFEQTVYNNIENARIEFVQSFYKTVIEKLRHNEDFIDLSSLLDNNNNTDFHDYGHTGPLTGEVIGGKIGKETFERIIKRKIH